LENPGVDGRIILRWIFRKWEGECIELVWFRIEIGGGTCKCGNEHSCSIKCGEILD
jgi:hypothetical protein